MVDPANIDRLFAKDKKIQSVSIVDYAGSPIASRARSERQGTPENSKQAGLVDFYIIKHILDLSNGSHGRPISLQIKREGIQQAIYYLEDSILYVTYEAGTKESDREVLDMIEECVRGDVIEI